MMKKQIILVSLLLLAFASSGQIRSSRDSTIKTLNDIGPVLARAYNPNADSLKNNCWAGCVFIRFNIDRNRQFSNIAYTANTPIFIKEALAKAFSYINQQGLQLIQLNNTFSKAYILPMIIIHSSGCGFDTGWEDKNHKPDAKMTQVYERRQADYQQFDNSVINMMNFTDGKTDFIDCILLAPAKTAISMN